MAKKAMLTDDQIRELHAEMKEKNITYRVLAEMHSLKPALVYSSMKRLTLDVIVGKKGRTKKEIVVV